MRLLLLVLYAGMSAQPAAARSLQLQGITGYLGEYELNADLSAQPADGGTEELSGPMSVRHVGLCTHSGPNEVLGHLTLEFAGLSHQVMATLSFDTHECTYRGYLSQSAIGTMNCAGKPSLPLRLWAK